jgi:hypothetical protein
LLPALLLLLLPQRCLPLLLLLQAFLAPGELRLSQVWQRLQPPPPAPGSSLLRSTARFLAKVSSVQARAGK